MAFNNFHQICDGQEIDPAYERLCNFFMVDDFIMSHMPGNIDSIIPIIKHNWTLLSAIVLVSRFDLFHIPILKDPSTYLNELSRSCRGLVAFIHILAVFSYLGGPLSPSFLDIL